MGSLKVHLQANFENHSTTVSPDMMTSQLSSFCDKDKIYWAIACAFQ